MEIIFFVSKSLMSLAKKNPEWKTSSLKNYLLYEIFAIENVNFPRSSLYSPLLLRPRFWTYSP